MGALGLLAAAAVLAWVIFRPSHFGNRVDRIGWQLSPPFQVRGPNGEPAGISVELVKLAAGRLGMELRWIYWNNTSESALVSKSVDLWPLITIRPERLEFLHISDAYLQHEHCFLSATTPPLPKRKT